MTKLAAIIPAAGLSSRMGAFKPLLPLGNGTVLSECISAFRVNHLKQIVLVTGKRAGEVGAEVLQTGIQIVHNPNYTDGMFSSVQTGVGMLDDDIDGFFMLPADMPLVRCETVGRLMDEFTMFPSSVVYPRFLGERGHPPVIHRKMIPEILAHNGTGGLRSILERYEDTARDLDVADYGTLHDLDHPADYGLARALAKNQYPTKDECLQIWNVYDTPQVVRRHCIAVSKVGEAICRKVNAMRSNGSKLNRGLVVGAALAHDIGKGYKQHEHVGAERLHDHGFHEAAYVIAAHTDLHLSRNQPLTEREIVFLSDKLVRGVVFSPLKDRYTAKMAKYGHEPEAKKNILNRLSRAQNILERFDKETGISMEQLAQMVLS
ncbi:DVU_1551 family NTP transferase [Pseudodesulfovibrio sediminis]|uniref:Molybdopterin-guanine dinucleotide biosynthesis protein MobA n=1 Tax=Pseudodesulfovibrio sediminis TaxID=2810563 RepID=A0ABM7P565_9BACT|nr:NTP transferase domain-containing protein [Pseudodesulfovibrio sediminis]BCS88054.1 molybdopterin-guanine dinucleotide biosynthesis protein MobA [Pseudodesulfovibrio sediminis]